MRDISGWQALRYASRVGTDEDGCALQLYNSVRTHWMATVWETHRLLKPREISRNCMSRYVMSLCSCLAVSARGCEDDMSVMVAG